MASETQSIPCGIKGNTLSWLCNSLFYIESWLCCLAMGLRWLIEKVRNGDLIVYSQYAPQVP